MTPSSRQVSRTPSVSGARWTSEYWTWLRPAGCRRGAARRERRAAGRRRSCSRRSRESGPRGGRPRTGAAGRGSPRTAAPSGSGRGRCAQAVPGTLERVAEGGGVPERVGRVLRGHHETPGGRAGSPTRRSSARARTPRRCPRALRRRSDASTARSSSEASPRHRSPAASGSPHDMAPMPSGATSMPLRPSWTVPTIARSQRPGGDAGASWASITARPLTPPRRRRTANAQAAARRRP